MWKKYPENKPSLKMGSWSTPVLVYMNRLITLGLYIKNEKFYAPHCDFPIEISHFMEIPDYPLDNE